MSDHFQHALCTFQQSLPSKSGICDHILLALWCIVQRMSFTKPVLHRPLFDSFLHSSPPVCSFCNKCTSFPESESSKHVLSSVCTSCLIYTYIPRKKYRDEKSIALCERFLCFSCRAWPALHIIFKVSFQNRLFSCCMHGQKNTKTCNQAFSNS